MLQLLSGITVIEVTNSIAAAYTGRLLADLGADVISLEPEQGSRLRTDRSLASNLVEYLMANKRSATLDLGSDESGRLARAICTRAQIVVYDASVPTLDRWLFTERVYADAPVVITVVTPYGLHSPYRGLCEDELLHFALSGIASVTPEEPEDQSVERPMQLLGHQAAFAGGLTAAVAALQGWFSVQQSGEATLVDVAVLDTLTSMPITSQAAVFAGHPLPKGPSRRPLTVPRGFLRCAEGYVYTQGGDDNWGGWARVLERPEWLEAPLSDPAEREKRWSEIAPVIQSWLDQHANTDVYRQLQALGITAFPVNSVAQVVESAQVQSRQVFRPLARAGSDSSFLAPRTAVRLRSGEMSEEPDMVRSLGADTHAIRQDWNV